MAINRRSKQPIKLQDIHEHEKMGVVYLLGEGYKLEDIEITHGSYKAGTPDIYTSNDDQWWEVKVKNTYSFILNFTSAQINMPEDTNILIFTKQAILIETVKFVDLLKYDGVKYQLRFGVTLNAKYMLKVNDMIGIDGSDIQTGNNSDMKHQTLFYSRMNHTNISGERTFKTNNPCIGNFKVIISTNSNNVSVVRMEYTGELCNEEYKFSDHEDFIKSLKNYIFEYDEYTNKIFKKGHDFAAIELEHQIILNRLRGLLDSSYSLEMLDRENFKSRSQEVQNEILLNVAEHDYDYYKNIDVLRDRYKEIKHKLLDFELDELIDMYDLEYEIKGGNKE